MKAYKDMTREELFAEKEKLEAMYQDYKGQNLEVSRQHHSLICPRE